MTKGSSLTSYSWYLARMSSSSSSTLPARQSSPSRVLKLIWPQLRNSGSTSQGSIPSSAPDRGRVVQIFRYSDLRHPVAETYDWRSTWYQRRSVAFKDFHPDLFIAPE